MLKNKIPRVVIIGRPNVGKSALFNRLAGKKKAVVADEPGVTRDGVSENLIWNGKSFELNDSAGIAFGDEFFAQKVITQVLKAMNSADLLLFVVEPLMTALDIEVAELLRKIEKPLIAVCNKIDGYEKINHANSAYELGIEKIFPVSAMTGLGTGDLLDEVALHLPDFNHEEIETTISIAIVGRPNVGKSTLLNKILGEDRVLVHDAPGTTRDAIDIDFKYFGHNINLVDTAGILRKQQDIEFYSSLRSKEAMRRSDMVFLVVDYQQGFGRVEKIIADQAISSYKGICLLINKWDLFEDKETNTAENLRKEFLLQVPFLKFAPFLFISALTGKGIKKALDAAVKINEDRAQRIPTPELNRFFIDLYERMPPTSRLSTSFKYAAQVGTSPPQIVMFHKRKDKLPNSFRNRITNALRAKYGFGGVPIKLIVKESK